MQQDTTCKYDSFKVTRRDIPPLLAGLAASTTSSYHIHCFRNTGLVL